MRKKFRQFIAAALVLLLSVQSASAVVTYLAVTATGPYSARISKTDGSGTPVKVDLTEGSGLHLGEYSISDANLVTGGLTASGEYVARIYSGLASAQANGDTAISSTPAFTWSGSAEVNVSSLVTGTNAISPLQPGDDFIWSFDDKSQTTSPRQITCVQGDVLNVGMDLSRPLNRANRAASVYSVTSVAISTSAVPPTLGTGVKSADAKMVNFVITTTGATKGSYTVTVTAVSTDSQTIVRKGTLVVQ